MKRRQFISSSGSASLAAASGGIASLAASTAAPAKAGEFSGIIKKATKFHMLQEPKLSVVDSFKLLKDIGFDGTELRTAQHTELAQYRKAVDVSEFPVHGIINSSNPDLETACKFASDIGGNSVLYVARYDRKKPLMDSWNDNLKVIRAGLPSAEKYKVKILVENVWAGFLISALDTERFVDEVNHPWFGSYFDVGNNVRWGVPEHWIQVLSDRIGKLDIKEWNENKHKSEGLRAGFGSELGEGTIDWAAVRGALKQIGFKGWATAEVKGGDRVRMAEIAERMDKVLDLA